MDRYEYQLKKDHIKKVAARKDYKTAAGLSDTIDWNKIKDVKMLTTVAEIYSEVKQYTKAMDVLIHAYEYAPIGRRIVYRLTELALEADNYEDAKSYFEEFCRIAPNDQGRYILLYRMACSQRATVGEKIKILEAYKREDFDERWAYELATLYARAQQKDKCVQLCDDIILWFGLGQYVEKALKLKEKYAPLTQAQQEKIREFERQKEAERYEKITKETPAIQGVEDSYSDIQVNRELDRLGKETAQAVAQSMEQELRKTEEEKRERSKPIFKKVPTVHVMHLDDKEDEKSSTGYDQTVRMASKTFSKLLSEKKQTDYQSDAEKIAQQNRDVCETFKNMEVRVEEENPISTQTILALMEENMTSEETDQMSTKTDIYASRKEDTIPQKTRTDIWSVDADWKDTHAESEESASETEGEHVTEALFIPAIDEEYESLKEQIEVDFGVETAEKAIDEAESTASVYEKKVDPELKESVAEEADIVYEEAEPAEEYEEAEAVYEEAEPVEEYEEAEAVYEEAEPSIIANEKEESSDEDVMGIYMESTTVTYEETGEESEPDILTDTIVDSKSMLDEKQEQFEHGEISIEEENTSEQIGNAKKDDYASNEEEIDEEDDYASNEEEIDEEDDYTSYEEEIGEEDDYASYEEEIDEEDDYASYEEGIDEEDDYASYEEGIDEEDDYAFYEEDMDEKDDYASYEEGIDEEDDYAFYEEDMDEKDDYASYEEEIDEEDDYAPYEDDMSEELYDEYEDALYEEEYDEAYEQKTAESPVYEEEKDAYDTNAEDAPYDYEEEESVEVGPALKHIASPMLPVVNPENYSEVWHFALSVSEKEDALSCALEYIQMVGAKIDRKIPKQVTKVTAAQLNRKDLIQSFDKLLGKVIIVLHAEEMEPRIIDELCKVLEPNDRSLMMVLVDAPGRIERLYLNYPELAKIFQTQFVIQKYTAAELLEYAEEYANDQDAVLNENAKLFVMDELTVLAKSEQREKKRIVECMINDAVEHAEKKGIKRSLRNMWTVRYDSEGRLILSEKDFETE